MMLLIYQDFITENLTVRFTIPVFSVVFKNSAAITNKIGHSSRSSSIQRSKTTEEVSGNVKQILKIGFNLIYGSELFVK